MTEKLGVQWVLVLTLAAALGCGTDTDDFGRCDPPLVVTVHTTPHLEFAWTPEDCEVYALTVLQTQQLVQWHLSMIDAQNGLQSPIRYGEVPPGASGSDTTSLSSGVPYTLQLIRLDRDAMAGEVTTHQFQPE